MKRKKIFPVPLSKLEAFSTKQLLARLTYLNKCEESLDLCDRQSNDDFTSDEFERIEFKQSPEWVLAFQDVKQVLSGREHVLKGLELAEIREARRQHGKTDRTARRLMAKSRRLLNRPT
ncbi:MAG: hypothetical protein H7Y37_07950 [Anaerolineae bacterium]|nr:hypothetical protein [Gloeobacterales cyanobacterium ES-bin-313]